MPEPNDLVQAYSQAGDLLQKAFKIYVELDRSSPGTLAEFAVVEAAFAGGNSWQAHEEWRISTWFDATITCEEEGSRRYYRVTVSCDGQILQARCPSLQKAHLVSRFYRHLIVNQFYSIGPPWA